MKTTLLLTLGAVLAFAAPAARADDPPAAESKAHAEWYADYDKAVAAAKAQNKPMLVAVSKPCKIERELGFIGTVYRYRYRAVCKKAVAPGKTFDVLTTSGSGRINVFVVVKDVLFRINK